MTLQQLADKYFSIFIRKRGADKHGMNECFVCGDPIHWEAAVCGHWQKRRHLATRYSLVNCQCLCGKCNDEGDPQNDVNFKKVLVKVYGLGPINHLVKYAHTTVKMAGWEYQEIIDKYK